MVREEVRESHMNRRMLRRWLLLATSALILIGMTGCLYPKDRLAENQAPPREAVRNVQAAIEQFQTEKGLLPIKNSSSDTPIYEKFVIDFAKLERMNYISDIPGAAYEKGGDYYFLLQNEETAPIVRLMSIVVFQQLNDLQAEVDAYKAANDGALPLGAEAYPSFYYLDVDQLAIAKPDIRSVFSGQPLSILVHENGTVFGDYGIDVRKAVEKSEEQPIGERDLRELLALQSLFVPVKSPAYVWKDGDPLALLPNN
jgi:hypothetical protein